MMLSVAQKTFRHAVIVLTMIGSALGQVRIKDVTTIENAMQIPLVGYGLVVGLDGTGDRSSGNRGAVFTVQTISNMLERFGITVPKDYLRTRNAAAAMITARTTSFGRVGSSFDVTVSSLGDATSLEGGVLLTTPLLSIEGKYFGQAQGPVTIGGFNIQTDAGEKIRKNHALVGRVPGGGILEAEVPHQEFSLDQPIRLLLSEADFITASRIAEAINDQYAGGLTPDTVRTVMSTGPALARSAGVVEITLPQFITTQAEAVYFIASVETLRVETDVEARVVINERTGTIVAGGNVVINEVMISHGNLTIHTKQRPVISQPQASFNNTAKTVVVPVSDTEVIEDNATVSILPDKTTVSGLATALNEMGVKPRDIIAIFQAIKKAGALNAKLIIM